jgi:hypothetical protein
LISINHKNKRDCSGIVKMPEGAKVCDITYLLISQIMSLQNNLPEVDNDYHSKLFYQGQVIFYSTVNTY